MVMDDVGKVVRKRKRNIVTDLERLSPLDNIKAKTQVRIQDHKYSPYSSNKNKRLFGQTEKTQKFVGKQLKKHTLLSYINSNLTTHNHLQLFI